MWKTVIILGCCVGAALASPLGTAKDIPMINDELINEKTEMAMSTLNLPSNATSIRADITDGFSCDGRLYGYYADVENDCQIFHVCLPVTYPDGKENTFRWSFICPDETLFSQESFTCVRTLDMGFDCAESIRFYDLNRNFGMAAEMDLEMHDMLRKTPTDETRKDLPETSKPVSPTTTVAPLPTRRRTAAPIYKAQPTKAATQAPIIRKKPVRITKPTTTAPVEIKPLLNRDQYVGSSPNVGLRKTVIRPQFVTEKPAPLENVSTQPKTTQAPVMEEEILKTSVRPVAIYQTKLTENKLETTTASIMELPSQTEKAIEQPLIQKIKISKPIAVRATEAPTQAMNAADQKPSTQMPILKDEEQKQDKKPIVAVMNNENWKSEDSTSSASNENKSSQQFTVLPVTTSAPLASMEAMDNKKSDNGPSVNNPALSPSLMADTQPEMAMEMLEQTSLMKDTAAPVNLKQPSVEPLLMVTTKPEDETLNLDSPTSRPAGTPLVEKIADNSILNEQSTPLLEKDEMNVSSDKDVTLEKTTPAFEDAAFDSKVDSLPSDLQVSDEQTKNAEDTAVTKDTAMLMNQNLNGGESESDNDPTINSESPQIEKTSPPNTKQTESITENSETNLDPLRNWFFIRETTPTSDFSASKFESEMPQLISEILMDQGESADSENIKDMNENSELAMQQNESDSLKSEPEPMTEMKVTLPQNPLAELESDSNMNPDMQNADIIKVISSLVNQAEQDASMKQQDNIPSVFEMRLPLPNEMAQLSPQANMNMPLGLAPHSNMNTLMATPALLDDPMFIPVQIIMDNEPLKQETIQPETQFLNQMKNNDEEMIDKAPSKKPSKLDASGPTIIESSPSEEMIGKKDETEQSEKEVTHMMLETNPVAMKENMGEATSALIETGIPLMSADSTKLMDEPSNVQVNSVPQLSESQTVKLEQPSSQPIVSIASPMSPDALTLNLGSPDTKPIVNQIMDLALNLVKSESMSAPAEDQPVVHDLFEAAKEDQNNDAGNFHKSTSDANHLDGIEMAGISDPQEIPMAPEPIEKMEQQNDLVNDLLRVVAAEKIGELVERTDLPDSILTRPDEARSLSRNIDPRKRRFLFKSLKNSR